MTQIVMIHDLVNKQTGKTFKEENLEKIHNIPLGALVEIVTDEDEESEYEGVRLYVVGQTRDCDGTPLYQLGMKGAPLHDYRGEGFYNYKTFGGFSEESLKVIK